MLYKSFCERCGEEWFADDSMDCPTCGSLKVTHRLATDQEWAEMHNEYPDEGLDLNNN